MKKDTHRKNLTMTMLFICSSICLSTAATLLVMGGANLMLKAGWLPLPENGMESAQYIVQTICSICILVSALITLALGKIPMAPFNDLIAHMNQLAEGNYKIRFTPKGGLRNLPVVQGLAESFNAMAQELENTQMLRDDFVNNFSHEFKTPIVSIAGFARLLKRGNLSPQEQAEYLNVIEEEALRLSDMATNVLNLSRVEKQTILTDETQYNLSEQIRVCILLLENKWSRKDVEFDLEFDEYTIEASRELLKQVWINLLDNAIKYSPVGGRVTVSIREEAEQMRVTVVNSGSEISPEHQKYIFDKFYQADASRSSQGNGVGLAIVKRIVELHEGSVTVESGDGKTAFTVTLPKNEK